jgi:hypothetical protein
MTKNFKIHEFECSCGCKMPLEVYENVIKLSGQLQKLRDYTGRAIIQMPRPQRKGRRLKNFTTLIRQSCGHNYTEP